MTWIEWMAVLTAAAFAGGALYVSFVEHPARMSAGVAVAVAQFRESYPRGARWQGGLAVLGVAAGALAFLITRRPTFALGALATGAVIPWTLVLMMPVNHRLMSAQPATAAEAEEHLLARWSRLHAVRSGLGVLALLLYLAR